MRPKTKAIKLGGDGGLGKITEQLKYKTRGFKQCSITAQNCKTTLFLKL